MFIQYRNNTYYYYIILTTIENKKNMKKPIRSIFVICLFLLVFSTINTHI